MGLRLGVLLAALVVTAGVNAQNGYVLATFGNPSLFNNSLGASVAIVGDVDGDSIPDYVVGDPAATMTTTSGAGEVRLISGATGTLIRNHVGSGSDAFGTSVSGAGDVDQDGIADYIVGAPGASPGGKAYVWSGATGSSIHVFSGIATFIPFPAPLPGTYSEQLGSAVSGPGDLDGDAVPDILVGCPGYSPSWGQFAMGRALVFSGSSGALLWGTGGLSSFDVLGSAVAGAGDLNYDGFPDIVIGGPRIASFASGYPPPPGYVQAFAGGSGAQLWLVNGATVADGFGRALAGAGDVNGDGFDDVIVGAPLEAQGGAPNAGRAVVISGVNGAPIFGVAGTSAGEKLGSSVSRAGDVNGDGFGDVLVGSPHALTGGMATGSVRLVFGAAGLANLVFSGLAQDELGAAVAGGFDLGGGGVPDVLVGATQLSGPGRVIALALPGWSSLHQVIGTPAALSFPVVSGAVVGDQDADGLPDVAFGLQDGSIALISGAGNQIIRVLAGPIPWLSPHWLRIAPLGDVDGDGFTDLAAAAVIGPNTAQLKVLSCATGMTLHSSTRAACGLDLVALATLGDVDGDGILDVGLGCRVLPYATCSPPTAGFFEMRSGATGALLGQANGVAPYDDFGASIAAAGDLNGDTVPDLVVGAPQLSVGTLAFAGAMLAFSGATGGFLFGVPGTSANQHFGLYVAGVGDVNGDGTPDLAGSDHPGLVPPIFDSVEIHSGTGGALLSVLSTGVANDGFGRPVISAGDVNGDGIPDIAASAISAAVGGMTGAGQVLIFSGTGGSPLFTVGGASQSQAFGDALAPAGDWNLDGLQDILATSGGVLLDAKIISFAGVPTGSQTFGAGCPLASGGIPALAAFGGIPSTITGNPWFGLVVSNAVSGSPGLLIAGVSTLSWGGLALPLNLGPYGLSGCSLFVSADVTIPITIAPGVSGPAAALLYARVPQDPSLVGVTWHLQAYVSDSPAAVFPGALTKALTLVLQ